MKSHSGDGGDVYSKSQIPWQKRRKIFIFSVEKLWKVLAKLIAYCIFFLMKVTAFKFKGV